MNEMEIVSDVEALNSAALGQVQGQIVSLHDTVRRFRSDDPVLSESELNSSSLISRNVRVNGKRTSVRLEPQMWRAFKDIARREGCTIHDLCDLIYHCKAKNSSLTAAIRVFLMLYYRAASTKEGHERAGHGDFENMRRRVAAQITSTRT